MQLKRKFEKGEFAILAEIEPPKGVEISTMVTNATCREKGWRRLCSSIAEIETESLFRQISWQPMPAVSPM